MNVYALVDKKAKTVAGIFVSVNDQTAVRSFEDLLFRLEDNLYNTNPQDFIICNAGYWSYEDHLILDNAAFGNVVADGSSYSKAIIDSKRLERAEYYRSLADLKNGGVANGIDSEE